MTSDVGRVQSACGDRKGTRAGWNQHVRVGEKACPSCQRANRDYMRELRRRGRCERGLGWPLAGGS